MLKTRVRCFWLTVYNFRITIIRRTEGELQFLKLCNPVNATVTSHNRHCAAAAKRGFHRRCALCSASHCTYQRGYLQFARILLYWTGPLLASWVGLCSGVRPVSASYRCSCVRYGVLRFRATDRVGV